jgi:hypothetical protein
MPEDLHIILHCRLYDLPFVGAGFNLNELMHVRSRIALSVLIASFTFISIASAATWTNVPVDSSGNVAIGPTSALSGNVNVSGTLSLYGVAVSTSTGITASGSPLSSEITYWTSNGTNVGGSAGLLIINTPTTTAGDAYVSIAPQGNYGSGSHTSSDGALNVDNSLNPNSFGEELYNSNNAATAPLLMVRDNYSTSSQGVAGIEILNNSTDPYPTISMRKNGYVPLEFIDTSLNNASGAGEFQINDRNDVLRIEGRQGDNSQYNVAALFGRSSNGGQIVFGGLGDILQTPANAGLFNVIEGQSSTMDYVDISSTSTSNIGNVFKITSAGNVIASGTITQAGVPVIQTIKQFLAPLGNFYPPGGSTNDVPTVNTVYVAKFYLPASLTVNTIGITITTAAAGSATRLGIYSEDGNTKYIDTSVTSTATGYATSSVASVVLNPGTYWEAYSMNTTTIKAAGWINSDYWGDSVLLHGKATNTASTTLPATLGTILSNGNNGLYELLTN